MPAAASSQTRAIAGAKVQLLAYVVNGTANEVDVYSYPGFIEEQKLTGFSGPQGACVDTSGDVWIADTNNSRLVEYAYHGSKPKATLPDAGDYPLGCAVSSASGTLAVNGTSGIALYAHAKGKPHMIAGSGKAYFLTYDRNDNLFGDGESAQYQFELFELASGAKSIEPITVAGATIGFPGAVQYVKDVLNVGDQDGAVDYQMTVQGKTATVTGSMPLSGSHDCVASFIYINLLLCPDAGVNDLALYRYPKGGNPLQTEPAVGNAVVISDKSK
ncbi:MAG TPA: hypothetical protein VN936_11430 [Candidatus Acidoferrum sp.]|nr:hypothetical protein [Candidatus Acidoferrum sp.]